MKPIKEMPYITFEAIDRIRDRGEVLENQLARSRQFNDDLMKLIFSLGKTLGIKSSEKTNLDFSRDIISQVEQRFEDIRLANRDCTDWYNQIREELEKTVSVGYTEGYEGKRNGS